MKPGNYDRRVLVCVTGLSPQVVTETLYALCVSADEHERFVPTEVYLLTTAEGAKRAALNLFSEKPGWFYRFCEDWGISGIKFGPDNILTFRNAAGESIPDIRSLEEHTIAADLITETLRSLTADENTALHVSIAGGRKTQGFLLGYVLSLFAREQDRLSHVLVSTAYEFNHEFYYPTPYENIIYTPPPEQRPLDAREAEVTLALIPIIPMRVGLPNEILESKLTYSEAIDSLGPYVGSLDIYCHVKSRVIEMGGRKTKLQPVQFAFYLWMARRRCAEQPGVQSVDLASMIEALFDEYCLCQLQQGMQGRIWKTFQSFQHNPESAIEYFHERVNRVNKALQDGLGARLSSLCEIRVSTGSGQNMYGLSGLEPKHIVIME